MPATTSSHAAPAWAVVVVVIVASSTAVALSSCSPFSVSSAPPSCSALPSSLVAPFSLPLPRLPSPLSPSPLLPGAPIPVVRAFGPRGGAPLSHRDELPLSCRLWDTQARVLGVRASSGRVPPPPLDLLMRRLLLDPFEDPQGGEVLLPFFLSGVAPVGARATRAVASVRLLVPSLALSTGAPPWAPGAPRLASPFPLSPPVLSLLRLASPLVALAGPSLPFPFSLPLPPPPFRRFHVAQDVPGGPPLGRAVVSAAVHPSSTSWDFLPPRSTVFPSGASTSCARRGPPSSEWGSSLGGHAAGGDALRRPAKAAAAEDGGALPTLSVACLRGPTAAFLAGEEVASLFRGAPLAAACRPAASLMGVARGRSAVVTARRRAGLMALAPALGSELVAAGAGRLRLGTWGRVSRHVPSGWRAMRARGHAWQQVRPDHRILPRRVGERVAVVFGGGAAVHGATGPRGHARVRRVDGGGG